MSIDFRLIFVQVFLSVLFGSGGAITVSQNEDNIDLNSGWAIFNQKRLINVSELSVPFSVHTALQKAGIIGDPHYRFNDIDLRWIALDNGWTFVNEFEITDAQSDLLDASKSIVNLELFSVDTVARIFLNDKFLMSVDNQFLKHKTESINSMLKKGRNKLELRFKSAVEHAKSLAAVLPYEIPIECPLPEQKGECHVNLIRKQQSSFSWDWGPAFAPFGLYDTVRLNVIKKFDMSFTTSVYPTSRQNLSEWQIEVNLNLARLPTFGGTAEQKATNVSVRVEIKELDFSANKVFEMSSAKTGVKIPLVYQIDKTKRSLEDVLWYPNGRAKDNKVNLFTLSIECEIGSYKTSRSKRIGFRSVELVQELINPDRPDQGLSFYVKINDEPIFLKGASWIPAEVFQDVVRDDYLKWLVKSARDANMNVLKVWGGGIYERDLFYDLADEHGIMIWQDFMFATSLYPTNLEFITNVQNEVVYQINRLKSHPSIVIWTGNVENEFGLAYHDWFLNNNSVDIGRYADDYRKLYIDVIKTTLESLDTTRPYLPSTPTNGKNTETQDWIASDPNDPKYGDINYYNYTMNTWVTSNYPAARMVTEYGYQSMPSFSNLLKYYSEKDMFYNSSVNLHRQHHKSGNDEMMSEVRSNLDFPSNFATDLDKFKSAIYLTQLNQAMGLKTSTEFFLRSRDTVDSNGLGKCMGAMYWQFNDGWTAPTWSTVEYGGQWKMGHYFIRDSFSNLIAVGYESKENFEITVISHLNSAFNGTLVLKVHLYDQIDPPSYTKEFRFEMPSRSSRTVVSTRVEELEKLSNCKFRAEKSCIIFFHVFDNNKPCLPNDEGAVFESFYLTNQNLAKVTNLKSPKLSVQNVTKLDDTNYEISIKTDQIGLFVWLDLDIDFKKPNQSTKNADFYYKFSQNGFHLLKTSKNLKLELSPVNNDLDAIRRVINNTDSLRSIIRINSLKNIYDSSSSSYNKASFLNVYFLAFYIFCFGSVLSYF